MTAGSVLVVCAVAMILSLRPAAASLLEGVTDSTVCDIEDGKVVVHVWPLEEGTRYDSLERAFMTVIMIETQGIPHWEEGKAFGFSG